MQMNDKFNIANYKRRTEDGVDPPNIIHLLNARQYGLKPRSVKQIKQFGELKTSVSKLTETYCELPLSARSTFLMSFSHDGTKVASTHGDHNIYVSDVNTGKHIKKLEGHSRTPWCITFHPTSNNILASGCLSGEVRVWDLEGGSERWTSEHDQVIASITFHPFRQLLVFAIGSFIYFWDWSQSKPTAYCSTASQFERVRYVKFDNYGHRLITGISNYNPNNRSNLQSRFNESRRQRNSPRTFEQIEERMNDIGPAASLEFYEPDPPPEPDDAERGEAQDMAYLLRRAHIVHEIANFLMSEDFAHTAPNFMTEFRNAEPVPETEENRQSNPDSDTEFFTSPEFWHNFSNIRNLCRELEDYLTPIFMPLSDSARASLDDNNAYNLEQSLLDNGFVTLPSRSFLENRNVRELFLPEMRASGIRRIHFQRYLEYEESDSSENEFPNPFVPITDLIGQIRNALRFSTFSITAIRERVELVFDSCQELVQVLSNWMEQAPMRTPIEEQLKDFFDRMKSRIIAQMDSLMVVNTRLLRAEARPYHRTNRIESADARDALFSYRVFERHRDVRDSAGEINRPSTSQGRQHHSENSEFVLPGPSGVTPRPRNLNPQRRRHIPRPVSVMLESGDGNGFREHTISFDFDSRSTPVIDIPSSSEEASDHSTASDIPRTNSDLRMENDSDSDSDRPTTPPLLMQSPSFTSMLFAGNQRIGLHDPLTQNHRIQSWDFTRFEIPAIYDATTNIVVRRCLIHNDASIDISQDGQKLVALIPPIDNRGDLKFGVFSLRPKDLGDVHCVYGFINNAISVSFSPLADYVLVGSAYSRPTSLTSIVAQIVKINRTEGSYEPVFIRCFKHQGANDSFDHASLNCAKWLPESGAGMVYATNRGCLCILKPMAGQLFDGSGKAVLLRGRRPIQ